MSNDAVRDRFNSFEVRSEFVRSSFGVRSVFENSSFGVRSEFDLVRSEFDFSSI